jgi:hypothetical protein
LYQVWRRWTARRARVVTSHLGLIDRADKQKLLDAALLHAAVAGKFIVFVTLICLYFFSLLSRSPQLLYFFLSL